MLGIWLSKKGKIKAQYRVLAICTILIFIGIGVLLFV